MLPLLKRLLASSAPASTGLIRAAVALVFVTSGAVKFLYDNQGAGRFLKLGFGSPAAISAFVGAVEILAGGLLLLGLLTRLAAVPLIIDMVVAIGVSKLPLLVGPGPEPVAAAPKIGLWAFLYVARLDLTMLACLLFLAVAGAGAYSLDALWLKRTTRSA